MRLDSRVIVLVCVFAISCFTITGCSNRVGRGVGSANSCSVKHSSADIWANAGRADKAFVVEEEAVGRDHWSFKTGDVQVDMPPELIREIALSVGKFLVGRTVGFRSAYSPYHLQVFGKDIEFETTPTIDINGHLVELKPGSAFSFPSERTNEEAMQRPHRFGSIISIRSIVSAVGIAYVDVSHYRGWTSCWDFRIGLKFIENKWVIRFWRVVSVS